VSKDLDKRRWFYNTSGGSTGEPIRVVQDDDFLRWATATDFYYYAHMLRIAEPVARRVIIWGSERDFWTGSVGIQARLENRLTHVLFLNSYRMSKSDMELYIDKITAFRPELIRGYAHALFDLCDYALRNKRSLYAPNAVVSSAELLTESMRHVI